MYVQLLAALLPYPFCFGVHAWEASLPTSQGSRASRWRLLTYCSRPKWRVCPLSNLIKSLLYMMAYRSVKLSTWLGGWYEGGQLWRHNYLASIEDPFDTSDNTARTLGTTVSFFSTKGNRAVARKLHNPSQVGDAGSCLFMFGVYMAELRERQILLFVSAKSTGPWAA